MNSLAARLRVLEGKVATVATKVEQQIQMLKGLEVRASEGGGPSGVATVLVDMCVGTDVPESELVGIASEVGSVYEALAASALVATPQVARCSVEPEAAIVKELPDEAVPGGGTAVPWAALQPPPPVDPLVTMVWFEGERVESSVSCAGVSAKALVSRVWASEVAGSRADHSWATRRARARRIRLLQRPLQEQQQQLSASVVAVGDGNDLGEGSSDVGWSEEAALDKEVVQALVRRVRSCDKGGEDLLKFVLPVALDEVVIRGVVDLAGAPAVIFEAARRHARAALEVVVTEKLASGKLEVQEDS